MTTRGSPLLERLLTLCLVLPFLIPLPLTVLMSFTASGTGPFGSLSRTILDTDPPYSLPAAPAPVLTAIGKASYQQLLATSFNNGFAGRSWLIRLAGEAYLRLFHSSPTTAVVGRRNSLYFNSRPYAFVDEYCVERQPPDTLLPLVDNLRRWRDNCRSRGVGFAIVITPSKASIYPEDLPAPWRRRYDPRPRDYDQFVRLLKAEKIRYIDGHLLTLDTKKHAPAPVFPDGGTHWNEYASLATTNALLSEWQNQGLPVRPIENAQTTVSNAPVGEDADMLGLVKTLLPPRKYPVSVTSFPPFNPEESRQPSLVMIGGSLLGTMARQLFASRQFSEIHVFWYYRERKEVATTVGLLVTDTNIEHMDVAREIFPAQCLVLEVNEQILVNPYHLVQFFADTMDRLPVPGAPGLRFPYTTHLIYRWGETLQFGSTPAFANPYALRGFASAAADGCWTNEPDAIVRLTIPDSDGDKVLTVDASALMISGKLPVQRVTVFANGQRLTEWAFNGPAPQRQTAVIPRALLGSGELILYFQFMAPVAADSSAAASAVPQPPALFFQQLTLQ